ncbi:hypothetical protein [Ruegeria sp. HKCCD7318]|uniref:hypothetical protein n=1 Tax=Ruegeria sp. HKCCD7318 TaxID=2683014 RepID=UPI001492BB9A|nr:hypothetical protein [Ruegeria sp. HKCCD7318]NOE36254.1 hypothetical protein [Ruegeria sp. HKCCD7318]
MNDEGFSEEEIFGRPLQDIQLEDLIAELRARLKEEEAVWPALLKVVRDHVVAVDDVAIWTDEWIKENK